VARSDPFETGVSAFSLSLNKAIVPFAFILAPGVLLIRGTGPGETVHVLTRADLADLGFLLPEVVVSIFGVFLGVFALGPTIIGYLYAPVGRAERALYAVAVLLLMAPLLLFNTATALAALAGVTVEGTMAFDVALRVAGGALLALLVARNRARGGSAERAGGVEAPTD